jgi:hypothetical protein
MTGAFPLQPARGGTAPADPTGVRLPVAGRVLERVEDETWLVEIAGSRITIQTPEALEPGARVLVLLGTRDADAVLIRPRLPADAGQGAPGARAASAAASAESSSSVTLPLLLAALAKSDGSPGAASRLSDAVLHLARSGSVPDELTRRLLQLLTPLPPDRDPHTVADQIQQRLEHGGLLLEAHIARALSDGSLDVARLTGDLRAAVGELIALLESMDGAPATAEARASASDAAREFVRDTLVTQIRTAADLARQGIWRFDLSLALPGRTVSLSVEWEPDRESRPDGRGAARRGRVSVFIDVAASGIEARIAWSPATLQVDLFTASDAVRDRLLTAMDDLTSRLSAAGFPHVVTHAWTNPGRLARWRLGASPDASSDARVFQAEA